MREPTRRAFLSGAAAGAASAFVPTTSAARSREVLNDASRLNTVPVFRHWITKAEAETDFLAQLRRELKDAAAAKRPVCVGAARHSMGGQSLPRNGSAMTFNRDFCEVDRAARTASVHAGTRWFEVIAHLDKIGFSPAVMQSNSDFGVAATFCVNAHGWPAPYGPFGSTVRSFRMMLADGSIVTCSRTENAELFTLAMGGYGLFGVILDLELDMVENLLLAPRQEVMPTSEFAARFVGAIEKDPAVRMMYGRLSVAKRGFFDEALLVTFRPVPTPPTGLPAAPRTHPLSKVMRGVYRAQIGSESAKQTRWFAETMVGQKISSGTATRNALMNQAVANLQGHDRHRTDILHEYFVPPERFGEFVAGCRNIIPKAQAEFLNVTLRYVLKDEISLLSYAATNRIAAVMSFSQEMTPEGEADMLRLSENLIDLAASVGGSFYLPYRLHARPDQLERLYPQLTQVLQRKRHYDPGLLFRNLMWDTYFAG
ncbi:FAD-binding oxidoreductase [Bosea sp. 2KB_26]|uniref:FAD-binding oxidoreductase n=1 Tax=Bosea sp. 2KB_26 TaxID=3237475 RepID=UPI003F9319D0